MDMIYSIRQLKEDFGKENVATETINKIRHAYADVIIKSKYQTGIAKKLEQIGLYFSEKHKSIHDKYPVEMIQKYSNYNVVTIIESDNDTDFKLMIQQKVAVQLVGTIVYYMTRDNIYYKLNHWELSL